MNVLIFEYITGGGLLGKPLPASLAREGELIRNCVASDFASIPDVNVNVMQDYRLQSTIDLVDEIKIHAEFGYGEAIKQSANKIDAMLIIAPETEHILFDLCVNYSQFDFELLNAKPESIKLCTDKYQTYLYLNEHGINQIPTYKLSDMNKLAAEKMVIKPKDGVGCENITLVNEGQKFSELNIPNDYIVQPYVEGEHISLSLLSWCGECILLSVNQQCIVEENNTLILESCIVNEFSHAPFEVFCKKLLAALPDLDGYIGVDLIVANKEIYLVEINPRLTTSYVGLRAALGINPAKLMLETFLEKKLAIPEKLKNNSVAINLGEMCVA